MWGRSTKRERNLTLTPRGEELEARLSDAQRARMRGAYKEAGPEAVQGFKKVLEAMMDQDMYRAYKKLRDSAS